MGGGATWFASMSLSSFPAGEVALDISMVDISMASLEASLPSNASDLFESVPEPCLVSFPIVVAVAIVFRGPDATAN